MIDTTPVRLVIADDHPMFRYGLTAVLETAPEMHIVGEAGTGAELLALVDRHEPDVVLTDIAMPDIDGIAATRSIVTKHPAIAVLILTMHEDDESLFTALRAGARGYLLKGADRAELVRAVLAVHHGDAVYAANIARRITAFFTGADRAYAAAVFPELTDREREILSLVAGGRGNHDIAHRLTISEKTVRNHVSAIMTKLRVNDRAAAVAKARDAGLKPQ